MSALNPPQRPHVKVCFRTFIKAPAVTGVLAQMAGINIPNRQVFGILPYTPLEDGLKASNHVACVGLNGERFIGDYTTLIAETKPSTAQELKPLMNEMTHFGGWDVEPIMATQINHQLRKMESVVSDAQEASDSPQDTEIVKEDISIEVDVVNIDVDSNAGFGSSAFTEEWA